MNISDGRLKNLNWFPTLLSRLWLNFILGLNLLFQTYYHALPYPKARENKVQSKDKVEPQHFHLYWVASLSRVKFASVKNTLNWSFSFSLAVLNYQVIFNRKFPIENNIWKERDCKTCFFFSKSVKKSVKRGVRVLHQGG